MDQPPVAAELKRVLPFGPTQIVDDVIDRDAGDRRASFRSRSVVETEIYIFPRPNATGAESLADIAVAKIIDEVRRDRPRFAGSDALAVIFGEI